MDISGTASALLLALLTAHRTDLVVGISPALERAFDYSAHKGALVLLTGYQTPAAIRRRGQTRLTAWLTNREVRGADTVAATAVAAAQAQHTTLPGEQVAAGIVAEPAKQILPLDDRLKKIEDQIRDTFRSRPQAEIIESLPGISPILGAGHKHVQAVIALAWRRVTVLWALLRDNRVFTPAPPVTPTA